MDGSNQIFIVLPIVAIVLLLVLVGLPFLGDREENRGKRSGAGPPPGPGIRSQVPSHSIAPDASSSDVPGPQ
jgi:hypothetical protein